MSFIDSVDPDFRQLVDLFLLSDKMDLDLSSFQDMLRSKHNVHLAYLWKQFTLSFQIAWKNPLFWNDRLSFLFSLNERGLSKNIENILTGRAFELFKSPTILNVKHHIEIFQFLELYKIKKSKNESFHKVHELIKNSSYYIKPAKIANIAKLLIPIVYESEEDFIKDQLKLISNRSFAIDKIKKLEKWGLSFDKKILVSCAKDLLYHHQINDISASAILFFLKDKEIFDEIKSSYDNKNKNRLAYIVKNMSNHQLFNDHFVNIKNLLAIEPSLADEITSKYIYSIYSRSEYHKRAKIDKIIKFLQEIPEISPKKVFSILSVRSKKNEIKYMLAAYPQLKTIATFG